MQEIFPSSRASRPAVGPTQPSTKRSCPDGKAPEFEHKFSCTSSSQYVLTGSRLIKGRCWSSVPFNLYLNVTKVTEMLQFPILYVTAKSVIVWPVLEESA